jgi:hypothetical protein
MRFKNRLFSIRYTTYAGVEGEFVKRAVRQETLLIVWHAIADLVGHLRGAALELLERVELGGRNWVSDPSEELLAGNNPHWMMCTSQY